MNRLLSILGLLTCIFWLPLAEAHEGGKTLQQHVGDRLVDIDYDVEAFDPGIPVIFTISLIDKPELSNWEFTPIDEVQVEIAGAKEPFRTIQKPGIPSPVKVTYTFPEHGSYTLKLRFLKNSIAVAEASFPLTVGTPVSISSGVVLLIVGSVLGAIALIVGSLLVSRSTARRAS